MSARSSATCSGVAVLPSTAEAASPGRTSVPANTSVEMIRSVPSAAAMRRRTKRAIGWSPRATAGGNDGSSASPVMLPPALIPRMFSYPSQTSR